MWAVTTLQSVFVGGAGGLDVGVDFASQHHVLSNASSLIALIAMVVHDILVSGSIAEHLANAFRGRRVGLFFLASGRHRSSDR